MTFGFSSCANPGLIQKRPAIAVLAMKVLSVGLINGVHRNLLKAQASPGRRNDNPSFAGTAANSPRFVDYAESSGQGEVDCRPRLVGQPARSASLSPWNLARLPWFL